MPHTHAKDQAQRKLASKVRVETNERTDARTEPIALSSVSVRRSGNVVGRINEVAVRRVRLVLGWVTVFGRHTTVVSLSSHPGQLSLLPSPGRELIAG